MLKRLKTGALALALLTSVPTLADPTPFDLSGPTLRVIVTRAGKPLPIAAVPNLAEGDQLSIRADLPSDESAHYLLVAAFLRGATNPPPDAWFSQAETWTRKGKAGLTLTVPAGAQQVVLFLAPETGGDFSTLRSAVRGRPGAFVRASQDLNQATLDRSRLDAFVREVQTRDPADPGRIARITPDLTRSLAIKLNPDCLEKMPDLQSACLMQNQDALVLNDGHSSALSDTLTGPGADLALQLSATPQGGLGYYSPYIAAVRDIIGILGSFHTAKYQYIPGLKVERGERISLLLNTAPSFQNPKSVLVTALPAVGPPRTPPLVVANSDAPVCASGSRFVVPVGGAPLVFSTGYAHDMALRIRAGQGQPIDLPATADAEKGGFVIANASAKLAGLGPSVKATLHGIWGFEPFDGPGVALQLAAAGQWHIPDQDQRSLVAGRADTLRLDGGAAGCVESVTLRLPSGDTRPVEWKASAPDRLALTLPLANVPAGAMSLLVKQTGIKDADVVPLRTYTESGRIDGFDLHAGDSAGVLRGSRLDQVASLSIDDLSFTPGTLARGGQGDELQLATANAGVANTLGAGQTKTARILFKDGRSDTVKLVVGSSRPSVAIVARNLKVAPETAPVSVRLTDPAELPHGATLTFSLRLTNGNWAGDDVVEIATASGSTSTRLAVGSGLALQDRQVAVVALDTAKAFGNATFGPLRFRVVQKDIASNWQPLATLVRLPALHQLNCPGSAGTPCELDGDSLYLIQSLATDPGFRNTTDLPDGYIGTTFKVPHPVDGKLYVKLRDDPGVANEIVGSSAAPPISSGTTPVSASQSH
jgi:hypothetical protein